MWTSRHKAREARQANHRARVAENNRQRWLIAGEPGTIREHIAHWLAWRFMAAHKFCCDRMRLNPETRDGNQDISSAPVAWYLPRFIGAWRLGKPYVIRTKREIRRIYKSVN